MHLPLNLRIKSPTLVPQATPLDLPPPSHHHVKTLARQIGWDLQVCDAAHTQSFESNIIEMLA